jgi:hypothetical protein
VAGHQTIARRVALFGRLCAAGAILAASGCGSGAAAIPSVKVNIDRVVADLLSEYDTNKNGALSRSELAAVPALAECLSRCRRNGNDEVAADNLKATLQRVFDPRTAVLSASCVVRRNGQPLAGANVRFVPLPVFKESLPVGSGVTDVNGFAMIAAAPEDLPSVAPKVALMTPGLYLVEVTHPTVQIPDKYNRQTVLGKEISTETVYSGRLAVDLKL